MSFEPLHPGDEGASAEDAEEGAEEDFSPLGRSRPVRWLFALIACLVVAALILSVLPSGGRPERPDNDASGVVSEVAADGSSFCMVLDSNGKVFCSKVLQTIPAPVLVVGQRVTGSVILVAGDPSVPYFVETGPGPSP